MLIKKVHRGRDAQHDGSKVWRNSSGVAVCAAGGGGWCGAEASGMGHYDHVPTEQLAPKEKREVAMNNRPSKAE